MVGQDPEARAMTDAKEDQRVDTFDRLATFVALAPSLDTVFSVDAADAAHKVADGCAPRREWCSRSNRRAGGVLAHEAVSATIRCAR
jgi:hypothetical protein